MDQLVNKYVSKLVRHGLAEEQGLLFGGVDAEFYWSRSHDRISMFEQVFEHLNINSFIYGLPKEPYCSIIRYLASLGGDAIYPEDTETRTFLHDLPIAEKLTVQDVVYHLKRRKTVLFPNGAIATFGTVSPEEAAVYFSSVCFTTYVKFMSDCFNLVAKGRELSPQAAHVLKTVKDNVIWLPDTAPKTMEGPFVSETTVCSAMSEAGRITVDHRLVDSHFGNVSCLWDDTIYISQTGSSLDELEGCIDPCPLDGQSSAGITASSELTAHRSIYEQTEHDVILHGHPKYCVIMSLYCEQENCSNRGKCHTNCAQERFVENIPIVCGEVGTGRFGLCHTVPTAMEKSDQVIVYGHGLFTASQRDFNHAVDRMFGGERLCMELFWKQMNGHF